MLNPYIDQGLVTLHQIYDPDLRNTQVATYQKCLDYGPQARWMALIDIDECLFPSYDNDLISAFRRYEGYGGIVVHP